MPPDGLTNSIASINVLLHAGKVWTKQLTVGVGRNEAFILHRRAVEQPFTLSKRVQRLTYIHTVFNSLHLKTLCWGKIPTVL